MDTPSPTPPSESLAPARLRLAGTSDTSVVVVDEVSPDINSVYVYPSRKLLDAKVHGTDTHHTCTQLRHQYQTKLLPKTTGSH